MLGIYELRNYRLHPGTIPAWQKTFSAGFTIRTKYSSPIGMWFSEIGGLNESKFILRMKEGVYGNNFFVAVLHIWPYKSMEDRVAVRQSCAQDPELSQCGMHM